MESSNVFERFNEYSAVRLLSGGKYPENVRTKKIAKYNFSAIVSV